MKPEHAGVCGNGRPLSIVIATAATRIGFWATVTSTLIALCFAAEAEQKVPVIGYLAGASAPTISVPDVNGDAFREGLRDLGYVDGKNIRLVYRYAGGKEERVQKLLAELLQLKIDALVSPYRAVIARPNRRPRQFQSSWSLQVIRLPMGSFKACLGQVEISLELLGSPET